MADIIKPDTPTTTEPSHVQNPPASDYTRNMNFMSLRGFFGNESPSPEEQDSLNYIYDYFENKGLPNMSEVMMNLKDIEMKLGIRPLGESRIISIKNYIKVLSQINELEQVKQSYERI